MGRQAKDLKFKPYVGLFFQFVKEIREKPSKASIGQKIYGNQIKNKVKYSSFEELPASILVIDEKRNHVKFLGPDNQHYWTVKTNIEPLNLPTFQGSPVPFLKECKNFLIYCTDTKIADFRIEKMTVLAMDLLPKIESMIKANEVVCFDFSAKNK